MASARNGFTISITIPSVVRNGLTTSAGGWPAMGTLTSDAQRSCCGGCSANGDSQRSKQSTQHSQEPSGANKAGS